MILVTGATGNVGGEPVRALAATGRGAAGVGSRERRGRVAGGRRGRPGRSESTRDAVSDLDRCSRLVPASRLPGHARCACRSGSSRRETRGAALIRGPWRTATRVMPSPATRSASRRGAFPLTDLPGTAMSDTAEAAGDPVRARAAAREQVPTGLSVRGGRPRHAARRGARPVGRGGAPARGAQRQRGAGARNPDRPGRGRRAAFRASAPAGVRRIGLRRRSRSSRVRETRPSRSRSLTTATMSLRPIDSRCPSAAWLAGP
jgi:hypothetical protein